MGELSAFLCNSIFDGFDWHTDAALLERDGLVEGIVAAADIPDGVKTVSFEEGSLAPGFVDLQVNGGGGVLFNNDPSVDAIRTICAAHARFGTTALLPTLITDTTPVMTAAIAAGAAAAKAGVPGFLGLHLEGPHLSVWRKGTHEASFIRPMGDGDLMRLMDARQHLPNLMVTVAAETVGPNQIEDLVDSGIIVSIGHSDADFETAQSAFRAGATQATHLFNAMSQLQHREPGVVGAVLESAEVFAGLIADGIHVHPAAIRVALRAKSGLGRIFLVTDAMSQTGTDLSSFELNARTIYRADGALRLADGRLAGADLDMIDAIHFMHLNCGIDWDEALRMASLYPSQALGVAETFGHLRQNAAANFVHLSGERRIQSTWIAGQNVFRC